MKIEIAESLISSYLKHVEGCRIVQTNWRTSGKWVITEHDTLRARALFDKLEASESFSGLFKNSSFDQLLKQAEIDVLGVNTPEGIVYGVDIAFHSAGLNYGSKEETASRIIKKIFRTIFIMQTYFDEVEKFDSYFITPKVNTATAVLIDDYMTKADALIDDENISIDFISNERFYSEIVDPLIQNSELEHDTADLFLRAIKLLQLDNRKTAEPQPQQASATKRATSEKRKINEMKIGQFVRHCFREAYTQGLITQEEIINLQNPEYSDCIFNAKFEVLRNINRTIKDEKGQPRYYAREVFCGNYRLSSQWYEPQWDYFLAWLKKIGCQYNF